MAGLFMYLNAVHESEGKGYVYGCEDEDASYQNSFQPFWIAGFNNFSDDHQQVGMQSNVIFILGNKYLKSIRIN